jgi:hypothetical protein
MYADRFGMFVIVFVETAMNSELQLCLASSACLFSSTKLSRQLLDTLWLPVGLRRPLRNTNSCTRPNTIRTNTGPENRHHIRHRLRVCHRRGHLFAAIIQTPPLQAKGWWKGKTRWSAANNPNTKPPKRCHHTVKLGHSR